MQDWISVNDRLPEEGQVCITYIGEPLACTPGTEIQIGSFYGEDPKQPEFAWGFSYRKSGFLGGYEVTHWMPLPDKPV